LIVSYETTRGFKPVLTYPAKLDNVRILVMLYYIVNMSINLAGAYLPILACRCPPVIEGILKMTEQLNSHTNVFETTVASLVTQDKALVKTTGKHSALMFSTILSGSFVAIERFPTTPSKEEKAAFGKTFLADLTPSSRKRVSTSIFKLVENHPGLIKDSENVADLQSAVADKFQTTKTVTDKDGKEKKVSVPCDSFNKLSKALNPPADKEKNDNAMISNNPDIAKLKKLFLMISKLSGDNIDQLTVYVEKMGATTDNPIVPLTSVEAFHTSLNKPLISVVRDINATA